MLRPPFLRGPYLIIAILLGIAGTSLTVVVKSWRQSQRIAESSQRMLRQLAEIRDDDLARNPLYSDSLAKQYELEYRMLPRSTPLEDRIHQLDLLAKTQIMVGQNQGAAQSFGELRDLFEKIKSQVSRDEMASVLLDLAVAHLRCGEYENCIKSCTCESCILPIRGEGIHTWRQGSQRSVEILKELLEIDPNHRAGRWLLNIACMTLGEYPQGVPPAHLIPPEAFACPIPFPRFTNVAHELGIDMVGLAGGVVADDLNGDGWIDLLISDWGPVGQIHFYRNDGQGHFVDETEKAGLNGLLGGLNMVQADYDNDGDVDIYVIRGAWRGDNGLHPDSLLQNDGRGHFRDVTFAVGLGEVHYPSQTAAWADYDLDGDLDLYVGNEDYPCQLFENDGRGQFRDVATRAGVTNGRYTKGVSWGDYNGDRYPDLYVSNYGTPQRLLKGDKNSGNLFDSVAGKPNRLYRNNRDGTFTDVAEELGVTRPLLSFPTWFWDVNNDGELDIFAASYSGTTGDVASEYMGLEQPSEPDCLYLGDGKGGFREVGQEFGLRRVTLAMGASFGDLDNDGFDDMYLGTGAPAYDSLVPNVMYWNQSGTKFIDVTGAGFGHLQKGHAIAFADLDNDGDQDVIAVMGGAYGGDLFSRAIFQNPGNNRHWICLKLIGKQTNRSAIGARIHVEFEEGGVVRHVYKWVNSGGSFGANPLRREIGLGDATKIRTVTIDWPRSQITSVYHDVPLDRFLEVTEGASAIRVIGEAARPAPPAHAHHGH